MISFFLINSSFLALSTKEASLFAMSTSNIQTVVSKCHFQLKVSKSSLVQSPTPGLEYETYMTLNLGTDAVKDTYANVRALMKTSSVPSWLKRGVEQQKQ